VQTDTPIMCDGPAAVKAGGDRALLERVPANQRSHLMNLFLTAVRAGGDMPATVVAAVTAAVRVRLAEATYSHRPLEMIKWARFREALASDPEAALRLAGHCIGWEALSPGEREATKAAKAEAGRTAWLGTQPPTPRQIAYLATLGYDGPPPASRLEASRLIDQLRGGRR
jgi:hypothetical protein